MKNHGEALRTLTRAKGLTQKDIADRLGISPQSVTSDFSEPVISKKRLKKYEELLDIDLEQFYAGEPIQTNYTSKDELIELQKQLIAELRKRLELQETVIANF